MPDSKGLTASENTACPQSCLNYRQAEATQDRARQDTPLILQSLVKAVRDDDGRDGMRERPNTNDGQAGSALLETIRLLAKLSPDERAALIGLLKTLG